jgi:hypothetical protein
VVPHGHPNPGFRSAFQFAFPILNAARKTPVTFRRADFVNPSPLETVLTYIQRQRHIIMSDTDYMTETDRTFSTDLLSTPRPLCPKCEMRMITVHTPHPSATYECLRCGHNEPKRG